VATLVPKPSTTRTGVWVGIGAIAMSFAAYTSAMIVRKGSAPEWQHVRLPSILYFNTILLLASSVTLEAARRRFGSALIHRLYLTLALGLAFLGGQLLAWRDLARQGLYLSTNPSSAFFYVFTAVHGLHLVGGLAALGYALRQAKLTTIAGPTSAMDAVALYWHFMGILWLYLMLVLALWL
jgi:cytochrome c oxidase subunit 3